MGSTAAEVPLKFQSDGTILKISYDAEKKNPWKHCLFCKTNQHQQIMNKFTHTKTQPQYKKLLKMSQRKSELPEVAKL